MHWTEHGALAIPPRATNLNGQWHQIWNSILLAN